MSDLKWETGDAPKLVLGAIGGDLHIGVSPGPFVEVQGGVSMNVEVREVKGGLEIECPGACRLLVPAGASLQSGAIGGDAIISGLSGVLLLQAVGGDLRLSQVGQTAVESVGGDLTASQIGGSLMVDLIGGRAVVERVEGAVHLRNVGGVLRLRGAGGPVQATVGGEAILDLHPPQGSKSVVQAGGDLRCTLPEAASVQVLGSAGGDMRLVVAVECEDLEDGCRVTLGQGGAELELRAGGDLRLRTMQEGWDLGDIDLGDAIAASVGAEIGTKMAELEFKLDGLGEWFDSRRIGRRVRRAVERAHRRAEQARQRAEMLKVLAQESQDLPSDEERLLILRMVEQGKLSVDEADGLLQALEG